MQRHRWNAPEAALVGVWGEGFHGELFPRTQTWWATALQNRVCCYCLIRCYHWGELRAGHKGPVFIIFQLPVNLKLFENVVAVQSLSRVRLSQPMHCSTTGFPVLHCLPEFTQTQGHRVKNYIPKALTHMLFFWKQGGVGQWEGNQEQDWEDEVKWN